MSFLRGNTRLEGADVHIEPRKLKLFQTELGRSTVTAGPLSVRPSTPTNVMTIQAMRLHADRPALWFMVRGVHRFKPYSLEAYYPRDSYRFGAEYTHLRATKTDEFGAASGMIWDPFNTASGWPDPAGIYRMRFTDLSTGRELWVRFVIKYDRSLSGRIAWWRCAVYGLVRRQLAKRTPESLKERLKQVRNKLGR